MSPITRVITIQTAGQAVRACDDTQIDVAAIHFYAPGSNAQKVLVGAAGLTQSMLANVITGLDPAANWGIAMQDGTNRLVPSDYWVDAESSGDKVVVTYWVG